MNQTAAHPQPVAQFNVKTLFTVMLLAAIVAWAIPHQANWPSLTFFFVWTTLIAIQNVLLKIVPESTYSEPLETDIARETIRTLAVGNTILFGLYILGLIVTQQIGFAGERGELYMAVPLGLWFPIVLVGFVLISLMDFWGRSTVEFALRMMTAASLMFPIAWVLIQVGRL